MNSFCVCDVICTIYFLEQLCVQLGILRINFYTQISNTLGFVHITTTKL